MIKVPTWFRVTLLIATILGGSHGATNAASLLLQVRGVSTFLLVSFIFTAYVLVVVAGLVFWKYPHQIRPLFWALAAQVPWISLPGFVYKFAAGLNVCVSLIASRIDHKYSAGFHTGFNVGSFFEIRFFQDANIEVGVNVAAFVAVLLLAKIARSASRVSTDPAPVAIKN